jgi:RNA polymerase sigma-70 factor (ECF subfamily)
MEEPEAKIMAAVAKGNFSAFRLIVERHHRPLINFVSKFVGDRAMAEDIAQEVFLRVFKAAKDYRPKARFKTWLFKIATNYCLNEIRASKRRPQFVDLFELNEAGFLAVAPAEYCPEKKSENEELGNILRAAIARLPEKQKTSLLLQKYEGFSYEEISHFMGCSVSAVESLIQRARQNLKKALLPYL